MLHYKSCEKVGLRQNDCYIDLSKVLSRKWTCCCKIWTMQVSAGRDTVNGIHEVIAAATVGATSRRPVAATIASIALDYVTC